MFTTVMKAGRQLRRFLNMTPAKPRQLDVASYWKGRVVVVVDTNLLLHQVILQVFLAKPHVILQGLQYEVLRGLLRASRGNCSR